MLHHEDVSCHRGRVVQLLVAQPGQVDRFHVLAQKLIPVRDGIGGHQQAVRVQRHEERVRVQAQYAHGLLKAGVVHVEPGRQRMHAAVEHGRQAVGAKYLRDELLPIGV